MTDPSVSPHDWTLQIATAYLHGNREALDDLAREATPAEVESLAGLAVASIKVVCAMLGTTPERYVQTLAVVHAEEQLKGDV